MVRILGGKVISRDYLLLLVDKYANCSSLIFCKRVGQALGLLELLYEMPQEAVLVKKKRSGFDIKPFSIFNCLSRNIDSTFFTDLSNKSITSACERL